MLQRRRSAAAYEVSSEASAGRAQPTKAELPRGHLMTYRSDRFMILPPRPPARSAGTLNASECQPESEVTFSIPSYSILATLSDKCCPLVSADSDGSAPLPSELTFRPAILHPSTQGSHIQLSMPAGCPHLHECLRKQRCLFCNCEARLVGLHNEIIQSCRAYSSRCSPNFVKTPLYALPNYVLQL